MVAWKDPFRGDPGRTTRAPPGPAPLAGAGRETGARSVRPSRPTRGPGRAPTTPRSLWIRGSSNPPVRTWTSRGQGSRRTHPDSQLPGPWPRASSRVKALLVGSPTLTPGPPFTGKAPRHPPCHPQGSPRPLGVPNHPLPAVRVRRDKCKPRSSRRTREGQWERGTGDPSSLLRQVSRQIRGVDHTCVLTTPIRPCPEVSEWDRRKRTGSRRRASEACWMTGGCTTCGGVPRVGLRRRRRTRPTSWCRSSPASTPVPSSLRDPPPHGGTLSTAPDSPVRHSDLPPRVATAGRRVGPNPHSNPRERRRRESGKGGDFYVPTPLLEKGGREVGVRGHWDYPTLTQRRRGTVDTVPLPPPTTTPLRTPP